MVDTGGWGVYNIYKIRERRSMYKNLTTTELASKVADVQFAAYKRFDVMCKPLCGMKRAEMEKWMEDQLRKCSFFDLIDDDVLCAADEMFNAHWVTDVASRMIGA